MSTHDGRPAGTASTTVQPIVALDVPALADARALVARLGPRADFYKVGAELFVAEGPRVVEWLQGDGKRVFLDLKLHDIPRTVGRAAEGARRLGAALVTVHAAGGEAMVRAAVEGAGDRTGVLAVTVLTSMDLATTSAVLGRLVSNVQDEVLRLAAIARAAGAHGVVCGGGECAAVRNEHGAHLRPLVPGIRLAGAAANDQARVVSPADAARAGAAYIVLGRALSAAADPVAAYERVLADIAECV